MKGYIFVGFCLGVCANVLVMTAVYELDRPQMVIDENGQCISAGGLKGQIDCKKITKADYGKFDITVAYSPLPK